MSSLSFILVLGALVGGLAFVRSLTSLPAALNLLVIVLVFGGIVATNLGGGGYAIPFRDLCIVLPLYLAAFASAAGRQALASIPLDLVFSLFFLLLVVGICVLNPTPAPPAQIIVGIKVWLFYVPFLAIGILLAYRPDLLLGLFRAILFWGTIACGIGLTQAVLVRILGYEPAIHLFFGQNASRVTQGFTHFAEAGGIYRIPATFSFVTQYGGFLCLYLTIAMIEVNADPDPRLQRFAAVGVFIAVLAALLSGTRSLILVLPAMLAAYVVFGVLSKRLMLLAPAGIVLGVVLLAATAVNPLEYFFVGEKLASHYAGDFVFGQISDSLDSGFLGLGIGASTTGARYALGGTAIEDGPQVFYEVFFAKAAAELGWLGFVAIIVIFVIVAYRILLTALGNLRHRENAVIAPACVYIAYNLISSFKGSALDVDPANIFFWLLLGVVIGYDRLRRYPIPAQEPAFDELVSLSSQGRPAG
jgi:hypothetical protein